MNEVQCYRVCWFFCICFSLQPTFCSSLCLRILNPIEEVTRVPSLLVLGGLDQCEALTKDRRVGGEKGWAVLPLLPLWVSNLTVAS